MTTRTERGSAALEAAIGVPAFVLFLGLIIVAGRIAVASQAVDAVATEAARTASIARTEAAATRTAGDAATASLATQGLRCATTTVDVDTRGFRAPVGTPAAVTATITCTVPLGDIAIPGLPGTTTVTGTATSPIDTYRART
ncbi:TadE/TadG family type IV pilus assembly protein [Phycicoccus sp.]|uniref:TadE/TadG family type IV pilus assembly protein n=1 Tax=Phycicoccus sp. TaxID=1902410 RepID=UPI002B951CC4|nr:TadE/TadG family type IV pilus assembly protein [Phycicoccus sp.]HMM94013.1 TadE/TadG family type IV pilus assembly protein [Phycicoccus sp.]